MAVKNDHHNLLKCIQEIIDCDVRPALKKEQIWTGLEREGE